jgi:hypothetical protein
VSEEREQSVTLIGRKELARLAADAARFRWLEAQIGPDADFNAIANFTPEFGYEVGIYHSDETRDVHGTGPTLAAAIDNARKAKEETK